MKIVALNNKTNRFNDSGRSESGRKRSAAASGFKGFVASVVALAMGAGIGISAAYADEAPITDVPSAITWDASYRVPAVDTVLGRETLPSDGERSVAVNAASGSAAVLLRVSVFQAAVDADVTVGGLPVLHATAGHDVSTAVLAPLAADGTVGIGASAAVDATVEVLASFGADSTTPGSTVALPTPVTRADTSVGLAGASLSADPMSVGLVGRGGVPADGVRAAYVTLDVTLDRACEVVVGGQSLALPAGRSIVSTIVVPDSDGNIQVMTDGATGFLRLDERGYVVGTGENLSAANVDGSYVPTRNGVVWNDASTSEATTGSVSMQRASDASAGIALVGATGGGTSRSFVEVGTPLAGRSHGAVVDAESGALPQMEIVEGGAQDVTVSNLGAPVTANVALLGDLIGAAPADSGDVTVSFSSVKDGDTLDFSEHAGTTFSGEVASDASVSAVEVYGDGQKIGNAAVDYASDGSAEWSFFSGAQYSGDVTYSVVATSRDGASAKASVSVTVELPDSSDTVTNGKDVVLPAGENSPIVALDDSSVTVNSEPTFHVGDIIVSDIAPNAPQGLLRWVDSIDRVGDLWIIGTHAADLTDAFYQVKIDGNTQSQGTTSFTTDDFDTASDVTINEPVDGGAAQSVTSSDYQKVADTDADVQMMASPVAQTATIGGDDSAKLKTVSDEGMFQMANADWEATNNRDSSFIQHTSLDFEVDLTNQLRAKHMRDSPRHTSGAKVDVSLELEAGIVFGISVVLQYQWFIPHPAVEYLKFEIDTSLSGDMKLSTIGEIEASVLIANPKVVQVFQAVIPVVLSESIPMYLVATSDMALSAGIHLEEKKQLGFVKDDNGGRKYANSDGIDGGITPECSSGGVSAGANLELSVGPRLSPQLKLYESVGIKSDFEIFLDSIGKFEFKNGELSLSLNSKMLMRIDGYFTVGLPWNGVGDIPEIDNEVTPKITFEKSVNLASKEWVLGDVCKSFVISTDGQGTQQKPVDALSHDSGFVLGDGMVKVTWKDAATGASKTGQLKAGDFFSVSQSAVAAQMGVTPGSLAGMKGVTVHATLMDYSVANGHSFQVPDDSIVVETYYDDPATEVVDGTTDADVAFVIDTTGSMWDEIADVKNNIEALTNTIHADSPTTRIAYLTYSDCYYANSGVRLVVPFTTETDTVVDGIKNAPFDGGGAEAVYSGLSQAADMDWRQNVKKSIILVGDEPATDPEPNGLTFDTTVAKLKSKDIQVYATGEVSHYSTASSSGAASAGTVADRTASDDTVAFSAVHAAGSENPLAFALAAAQAAPGGDVALDAGDAAAALTVADAGISADGSYGARTVNDWGYDWTKFATELSEATGGHFVEYTRDDFVNRLTETVVDAVKRPDVNVELGHSVYTGDQADFAATAVTHQENDPVVSYEWDFGNGQTMTTAPGATASTAYAADGTYSVIVKAVTQSGLVGSTVYQLTVGAHQAPYMYNAHKVVSRSASGVSPVRLDVLNDPGEEFASVAFSNGSDTIAVPGEGTWTIGWDAENGLLEATFTPESGFAGGVTSRVPYTVTNSGGLSGTGELWVRYVS